MTEDETPAAASGEIRGEDAGVVIRARLGAWTYDPADLDRVAAPLFVQIENRSGRPLRLQPSGFQLIRSDATRFEALPVSSISGMARQVETASALPGGAPIGPTITERGGFVAGRSPDRGGMDYDPFRLDRRFVAVRSVELPTSDMLRRALTEELLASPGMRQGFLYFEPFGPETRYAAFQADLVDAATGRPFGTVRIPFARRP